MPQPPTLHFFCGKAASGKSTHAARLADAPHTVLLSEDHWLHALYGDQMTSLKDYVHFTQKLRRALTPMSLTCCSPASRSCSTSRPTQSKAANGCAG